MAQRITMYFWHNLQHKLLIKLLASGFVAIMSFNVLAQPTSILVLTKDKQATENIGISITPLFDLPDELKKPKSRVMNQINTQFSPHILMAQKGAQISFPNSDSVQHHVYSFSEAKTFELKLYKDQKPEPLKFDSTGDVTLGCNIHDWMLGYIYVVDTPFFGKTNESGLLTVDLPEGKYEVKVHSPLLQSADINTTQQINVANSEKKSFTISLSQPLLPSLNEFEDGDEFDAY